MSHTELAQTILDESGYTDMLQKDRSPQAQTRLDNLKELINAMGEFENLTGFLGTCGTGHGCRRRLEWR